MHRAAKFTVVGLAAFFITSDLFSGVLSQPTINGIANLIGPYLPLLAMAFSPSAGAIVWIVTAISLAATTPDNLLLNAFIFPTFITVGICAFFLRRLHAIVFISFVLLWTLSMPFFSSNAAWTSVAVMLVLNLLSAAVGFGLHQYRNRLDRSIEQVERLEEEQARARAEERRQLSHELHDIVAHGVTIIAMQARRAECIDDQQKMRGILQSIGETAQLTLQDLRRLVLILQKSEQHEDIVRDSEGKTPVTGSSNQEQILKEGGSGETTTAVALSHDLHQVTNALREAGFDVKLTEPATLENIPTSLRQSLRRTVNELGTNILKHADPSSTVSITLEVSTDQVALSTINKTSSTPPIMSSGTGLTAIKERAEAMNGTFTSRGGDDGSWFSRLAMPLSVDANMKRTVDLTQIRET